jgi:hypothetical protein
MTTLVEDPMPLIFLGIVGEAVLGIILLKTGRGALLWAMAALLGIVLAGIALEGFVVTEREEVEATLEGVAAALQANNRTRLLNTQQYLTNSAGDSREQIRWALDRVTFSRVRITDLEITINRLTNPPTARARVEGIARFKDRRGEFPYESYPINDLIVNLRLESGRWLITGHEWAGDPRR